MYRLPLSTYTYLVKGFLAEPRCSLRKWILSRFPGFHRNLLASPSREVRKLAKMLSEYPRSTTVRNLGYLRRLTGMEQAEQYSSWHVFLLSRCPRRGCGDWG